MRGLKFRRQHPIGPFVADFYSPEARLAIEVDGGQHVTEVESDRRRTEFLERQGYRIHQALGDPHPDPLPGRERERRA